MRDDRGQRVRMRWEDLSHVKRVRSARWRDAPRWFTASAIAGTLITIAYSAYVAVLGGLIDGLGSAIVLLLAEWMLCSYLLPVVNTPIIARARGFCAACLYNMDGIPPDPDGCTVCPECSAAWLINTPIP